MTTPFFNANYYSGTSKTYIQTLSKWNRRKMIYLFRNRMEYQCSPAHLLSSSLFCSSRNITYSKPFSRDLQKSQNDQRKPWNGSDVCYKCVIAGRPFDCLIWTIAPLDILIRLLRSPHSGFDCFCWIALQLLYGWLWLYSVCFAVHWAPH